MTFVWDGFPSSGSELLIMLALADWCDDRGGSLYPSIKAVGEKARVGEKHARNIMHKLEAGSYLAVVGNHAGGKAGTTRQYRLNVAKLKALSDAANAKKEAEKAAKYGAKKIADDQLDDVFNTTPLQVTPNLQVTDASLAGDPYASPTDTMTPPLQVTLTTNEPSIILPIEPPTETDIFAGIPKQIVSDYLQVRKEKGARTFSKTAFDGLVREAVKAGYNLEQALTTCIERNWTGFNADWVASKTVSKNGASSIAEQNRASTEAARKLLFGNMPAEKDISNETVRL